MGLEAELFEMSLEGELPRTGPARESLQLAAEDKLHHGSEHTRGGGLGRKDRFTRQGLGQGADKLLRGLRARRALRTPLFPTGQL